MQLRHWILGQELQVYDWAISLVFLLVYLFVVIIIFHSLCCDLGYDIKLSLGFSSPRRINQFWQNVREALKIVRR